MLPPGYRARAWRAAQEGPARPRARLAPLQAAREAGAPLQGEEVPERQREAAPQRRGGQCASQRSDPSDAKRSAGWSGEFLEFQRRLSAHRCYITAATVPAEISNQGFFVCLFVLNVAVGTASQRTAVSLRRAPAAKRLRLQQTGRKGRTEAFSHANGKQGAKTGLAPAVTGCHAPPSSQNSLHLQAPWAIPGARSPRKVISQKSSLPHWTGGWEELPSELPRFSVTSCCEETRWIAASYSVLPDADMPTCTFFSQLVKTQRHRQKPAREILRYITMLVKACSLYSSQNTSSLPCQNPSFWTDKGKPDQTPHHSRRGEIRNHLWKPVIRFDSCRVAQKCVFAWWLISTPWAAARRSLPSSPAQLPAVRPWTQLPPKHSSGVSCWWVHILTDQLWTGMGCPCSGRPVSASSHTARQQRWKCCTEHKCPNSKKLVCHLGNIL